MGLGYLTPGPDDFRVQATNMGGGWLFMDAPIDASGEDLLEVVVTANPDNVTTAFNVVLFSGAGTADQTEAGFTFELSPGTQTLTADLWNPTFFNRGDINTWNPADLWDQWHLQGTFANSDALDLTFDNLALISGGGGFTLSLSGDCPGQTTVSGSGATPGGRVAVIRAFGEGNQAIPQNNPCAGTELGLNRTATLVTTIVADGNGDYSFSGNAPSAACGLVFLQTLDIESCSVSNVELLQ